MKRYWYRLYVLALTLSPQLLRQACFKNEALHYRTPNLFCMFVHFHMLFIDGVYRIESDKEMHFIPFKGFSSADLSQLNTSISHRIARHLERKGYIERDAENSYLSHDFFEQD